MGVIPTWIGRRGLAAFLHLPASSDIRGAVLLCHSLGSEQAWAYRGMRDVADRLCEQGYACLRFDYRGTGHSAGDLESDGTADLTGDAVAAAEYLHSVTGLAPIAVAFGAGALVLATAFAGQPALEALVLWEPAITGRRWLREQEALLRIGRPTSKPVAGEIPGLSIPPEILSRLSGLTLAVGPELAVRTLVLARAGSPSRRLADDPSVEFVETTDTDELLFGVAHPVRSVDIMTAWVTSHPAAATVAVTPPDPATIYEFPDGDGSAIRERFVDTTTAGLFGVISEPAHLTGRDPVVFVTTSCEPAIGPGREWVRLAREAARAGRSAVRLDLGGFGDSPAAGEQFRDTCYPAEAVPDLLRGLRTLTDGGTEGTTVVGMCSGAFHAFRAATEIPLSRIIGVNPAVEIPPLGSVNLVPRRRRVINRLGLTRLSEHALTHRVRQTVGRIGWRVASGLGRRSPLGLVEEVVATGTEVIVLCGPDDADSLLRRGGWIVRRLGNRGLTFRTDPGLGHSALSDQERRIIHAAVSHALTDSGSVGAVGAC